MFFKFKLLDRLLQYFLSINFRDHRQQLIISEITIKTTSYVEQSRFSNPKKFKRLSYENKRLSAVSIRK